ncbi:MAG TPA: AbrB/MazE/SpoVT family DNA-binding domain-containing protein [Nitrososphaerales archaeon]|nr:AbrB/MazE/SpoVT family DNA-binding domain-containing protein [Nitrososphaerales archaeon]
MAAKSTIGPKGQITLPKAIREKYHLLEGEEVVLVPQEEGVLVKHTPNTLRGKFRGRLDIEGFERDVKRIHKEWKL